MRVYSDQNTSGLSVDPTSIDKQSLNQSLLEKEDEIADTNTVSYQASTGGLYSENQRKDGQIQFLVVPSTYPNDPNSSPELRNFNMAGSNHANDRIDEVERSLSDEYEIGEWIFQGLEEYHSREKSRDQDRQEFIDKASEMPLSLTATVDIGLEEVIRIGWFNDLSEKGFGYSINTGNPGKSFSSDDAESDIETYLKDQEFWRDKGEKGYSDQEIEKIMQFDRKLFENNIL